jgi:Flp pilus assembly protein TadD
LGAAAPAWGRNEWLCVAVLAAATLIVFGPALQCGFVFDDEQYVSENAVVRSGLTAHGFFWAWTTTHAANWHPLTWLSLMLDGHLLGTSPWSYHLVNVLLHVANTLLLFVLLWRLTGATGRSALVAALFAMHPLRVESVAWVSERKDVLSTLFGLWALLAYVRYARAPSVVRYLLVGVGLALSLLAKPMLVTLPAVFLLLDYWPLGRRGPTHDGRVQLRRLVLEKLPLLALCVASCVVTLWAQARSEAVQSLTHLPPVQRLANAALSYTDYLRQMVLPSDLAPYYPHPRGGSSGAGATAAGLFLAAATVVAVRLARRYPYLAVGWLWYLGTLVPVIGLVQVGDQARADRYTYFPLIGIFLMLVWGLADLARRWRCERPAACLAAVLLVYLGIVSWGQVHYWHDSVVLWEHTLAVAGESAKAHINLGKALKQRGDLEGASRHYRDALRLEPDNAVAHNNLGVTYLDREDYAEAARQFREALRLEPDNALAHNNLGIVLLHGRDHSEAVRHFQESLRLDPNYARAHNNLGLACLEQGQSAEAELHFRDALRLEPNYARAHHHLGLALRAQGKEEEAARHFAEALRLGP